MQGTLRSQCLQAPLTHGSTAVFLMCSPTSAQETLEQFQRAGQLASRSGLIPRLPLDTDIRGLPVPHTLARSALLTALHLSPSESEGQASHSTPCPL